MRAFLIFGTVLVNSLVAFADATTKFVSQAEGEKFGQATQQLVNALITAPYTGLLETFDLSRFQERALGQLAVENPKLEKDLRKAAESALFEDHGFFHEVIENVARGGSYEFLGVRNKYYKKNLRTVAVFRMVRPSGVEFNYHDYLLAKADDAVVKAVDVYSYESGEDFSETTHRQILTNHGSALNLSPADRMHDYWVSLRSIQRFLNAVKDRNAPEAQAIYKHLPLAVQRDSSVLLQRFRAAWEEGLESFEGMYRSYPREYASASKPEEPQAPARDLISIDGFPLFRDYSLALDSVDNIQKSVGFDDTYLKVVRATLLLERGTPKEAWTEAKGAFTGARNHGGGTAAQIHAYWTLVRATAIAAAHEGKKEQASRFWDTANALAEAGIARSDIKNFYSFPELDVFTRSDAFEWCLRHAR